MKLQTAQQVIINICKHLQLFCQPDRIKIAGSVRRKCREVRDLEIVCLPAMEKKTAGLFLDEMETRNRGFIKAISEVGKLEAGNAETGRYLKIRPNNLDINLDLFIPNDNDYFRQFAIRTGSKDYANRVIAGGWLRLGWCGSDKGLRKIVDCINEKKSPTDKNQWKCVNSNAERPPVWQSEKDFFKWLNVEWIPPEARFFTE